MPYLIMSVSFSLVAFGVLVYFATKMVDRLCKDDNGKKVDQFTITKHEGDWSGYTIEIPKWKVKEEVVGDLDAAKARAFEIIEEHKKLEEETHTFNF